MISSPGASLLLDVACFREGPPDQSDYVRVPPHVVVEMTDDDYDIDRARSRAALLAEFGVKSVGIVDPGGEKVIIFEAGREQLLAYGDRLRTPAVPGLDIDVSELFTAPRRQSVAISSRQPPRGRC